MDAIDLSEKDKYESGRIQGPATREAKQ